MVNAVSKRFSREQLLDRAFHRIAWNIKHMWEETGNSDTRLLNEPLIPDSFVIVGQSKAATEKSNQYREHVVPRVMICEESHRMFERDASVEEVGRFIREHLKIIFITKDEQDRLDKGKNQNLRQKMPPDWTFGSGSVYSRLEFAGIEFELFPG